MKIKFIALMILLGGAFQGYTQECCTPSHATRAGDWITRLRVLYVVPDGGSGIFTSIPGAGMDMHSCWTSEFDTEYMFTPYLSTELALTTCRSTIMGTKAIRGSKVGATWLLPPTLTLKWRLAANAVFQTYVGAGVNYTVFYGSECNFADTRVRIKNSWGPVVQIGVDIFAWDDWLLNADIKYIWMDTAAHLIGSTSESVNIRINPWFFGFGFGRKW